MHSPYLVSWKQRDAEIMSYRGWDVPLHFGNPTTEHLQVRAVGGVHDAGYWGVVHVQGKDARDFLNRMTTVDLKTCAVGQARRGLLLDNQGKIQSLFRLLYLPDAFLLITQPGLAGPTVEFLEKYHISENLAITDVSGQWLLLGLHGRAVAPTLQKLGNPLGNLPEQQAIATYDLQGGSIYIWTTRRTGDPGYEILAPVASAEALWKHLQMDTVLQTLKPFGLEAENSLRFEAGEVNIGMEVDGSIIPLEARLDDWAPQNQGCYIGQEVVERIRTLKHVPKLLTGFFVESEQLLPGGTPILVDTQQVGVIVNCQYSPSLQRILAVGYVRRQALDGGKTLSVPNAKIEKTNYPFYP